MSEIFDTRKIQECHEAILNDRLIKDYTDFMTQVFERSPIEFARDENYKSVIQLPMKERLLIDEIKKKIEQRQDHIIMAFGIPPNILKRN